MGGHAEHRPAGQLFGRARGRGHHLQRQRLGGRHLQRLVFDPDRALERKELDMAPAELARGLSRRRLRMARALPGAVLRLAWEEGRRHEASSLSVLATGLRRLLAQDQFAGVVSLGRVLRWCRGMNRLASARLAALDESAHGHEGDRESSRDADGDEHGDECVLKALHADGHWTSPLPGVDVYAVYLSHYATLN